MGAVVSRLLLLLLLLLLIVHFRALSVTIRMVPSHTGIEGNEIGNAVANETTPRKPALPGLSTLPCAAGDGKQEEKRGPSKSLLHLSCASCFPLFSFFSFLPGVVWE